MPTTTPLTDTHPTPNGGEKRRPRADCTHTGHPHQHGTRTAYVKDRCRCPACTAANTAASRTRRREHAYGRIPANPLTDVQPARDHITTLRAAGHGYQTIAHLAGISTRHLRDIARTQPTPDGRPPIRRIRARLADAILAVPVTTRPALVDATGTQRRICALIALGWPTTELARRLTRRTDSLRRTIAAKRVTASTAAAVARLFNELAYIPPPDTTAAADARAHARREGWASPLAWDDIDADEGPAPGAPTTAAIGSGDLDEVAVERVVAGQLAWRSLTMGERTESIRRLTSRGFSMRAVASHLGASPHTIRRYIVDSAA